MKTFLWTQNEKPMIPNTLIINHDRSEFDGNAAQNEAMKILSSTYKWEVVQNVERGNLNVQYKLGEAIVISSCFKTRDVSGRPMPFSFYCDCDDIRQVVEQLRIDLDILRDNREYDNSEIEESVITEIDSYIAQKKKNKKIKKIVGILTLILFLIGLISIITNKNEVSKKSDSTNVYDMSNDSVNVNIIENGKYK